MWAIFGKYVAPSMKANLGINQQWPRYMLQIWPNYLLWAIFGKDTAALANQGVTLM